MISEQTCPIAQLDRSQSPPGYYADGEGWGIPFSEEHGKEADQPANLAAAWSHFEAANDPPGMRVLPITSGPAQDDDYWVAQVLGFTVERAGPTPRGAASENLARAAAWAWYWRRVKLADALDALARQGKYLAAVGTFEPSELWPEALRWPDHYVKQIEVPVAGAQ